MWSYVTFSFSKKTKRDEFTIKLSRNDREMMKLDAYWFPNQTLKMQGLQDELSGTGSAVSCS